MSQATPPAEVELTPSRVRGLLAAQCPHWAELPLTEVGHGWDNAIYRLGEDRCVRLPRRELGGRLIRNEQRWLPALAPRLNLQVPIPEFIGSPQRDYPWSWSVVPWFEGDDAVSAPLADPPREARRLGRFLRALWQPAPEDAPVNRYRGVELACREAGFLESLSGIDLEPARLKRIRRLWRELRRAAPWPGPPVWLHGDLHALNLLVHQGRIHAVIDWGDLTAGDPATDLAVAWMVFEREQREILFDAAGADRVTRDRARAWGLIFAALCLGHSTDASRLSALGKRLLSALLEPAS